MKLSHVPGRVARLAVVLAASGVASIALATEAGTWRCGNTYSDQPCKGGRAVEVDDTRDAAQKRAGDASAREAQSTADRMERERLRQESALARRKAIVLEDSRAPVAQREDPAPSRKNKKGKKEADYFSAHDPAATAKKKEEKAAKKAAKRDAAKA